MITQFFSWTLGLIDHSCSILLFLLPKRHKFFSSGWGNKEIAFDAQAKLLNALEKEGKPLESLIPNDKKLEWGKITNDGTVIMTEGQFLSPIAHLLPEEAKYCRFRYVEPRSKEKTSSSAVVIMLPATGEMGKSARLRMARSLAEEYGWSSVIVTAPYYGSRKPKDQKLSFIGDVENFILQSQAIMEEAATLACYFQSRLSSKRKVCISGFSWGAAMSSCASGIALLAGADGKQLACVPYVGSATPAVLADGILAETIDWEALKETKDEPESVTRQKLFELLNNYQLSSLNAAVQQKGNYIGAVRAVAMHHDHFIRLSWVKDFMVQLQQLGSTTMNFSVQWLPGGHVFAALVRPWFQKKAIVEAVQALP